MLENLVGQLLQDVNAASESIQQAFMLDGPIRTLKPHGWEGLLRSF